ncbi:MAG: hypothetical protein KKB21_01390 [Nanoarchaeota archaeon]|nr:hypothetical protein [Nanoarchaeota archaeon]MBU4086210.1 hypothetical protein [Nanoarchaeota archaeon]
MIKVKKEKVLITPKMIKPSLPGLEVLGTFNPGATRLPNGDIVLYVRVMEKLVKSEDQKYVYSPRMIGENDYRMKLDRFDKKTVEKESELDFVFKDGRKRLTFISHFRRVVLDKSGFIIKSIDSKPSFYGMKWDGELGVEDPRITKINDLYVMTYVTLSLEENISTSYAISNDCLTWYRRGIIFGEQEKDVVIFPEMINNLYVAFDRPEGTFQFSLPHIWISYSENLEFWGGPKSIAISKEGDWDYSRNGAGPPPIKTKDGWLFLYHVGAEYESVRNLFEGKKIIEGLTNEAGKKYIYSVGAALFDLKNPSKVIARAHSPVLIPDRSYEKGTFENKSVVFPTGMMLDENGRDILIFSGGGDVVVSVKKVALKDILDSMKKV